jgi:hypothetical protein
MHLIAGFYQYLPIFRRVGGLHWYHYHILVCVRSPLESLSHVYITRYHSSLTLPSLNTSGAAWLRFGCFAQVTMIYDMEYFWGKLFHDSAAIQWRMHLITARSDLQYGKRLHTGENDVTQSVSQQEAVSSKVIYGKFDSWHNEVF